MPQIIPLLTLLLVRMRYEESTPQDGKKYFLQLMLHVVGGHLKNHVGVMWFIFHVLQFPSIRFTQQNVCCTCKSMMKHNKQNHNEN